jgi:hypothetical protein
VIKVKEIKKRMILPNIKLEALLFSFAHLITPVAPPSIVASNPLSEFSIQ